MKTTVGERGQITIPKPIRERLGIRPGQRLEIHEEDGRVVVEKTLDEHDPVAAVYGILKLPEGWDTDAMIEAMRGPARFPPDEP